MSWIHGHIVTGLVAEDCNNDVVHHVLKQGEALEALRVSQILDGGAQNPADAGKTLRVSLRTSGGVIANAHVDVVGTQSVPHLMKTTAVRRY